MSPSVQVGAILIEAEPAMTKLFGIESEPYFGSWSVVRAFNGFALDRGIHAAGWNFSLIERGAAGMKAER